MALGAEDVSLHVTRLPIGSARITVSAARSVADRALVEQATRDLLAPEPEMVAYGCAAGSFVEGDCALGRAMLAAGAPAACTTCGALVEELRLLGVSRVAVVSPYTARLTRRLVRFLAEHEIRTVMTTGLGPLADTVRVIPWEAVDSLRGRASEDAEAIFICCTNMPTYDLLRPLAKALGKPVLTANEVLMRAALRAMGTSPIDGMIVST